MARLANEVSIADPSPRMPIRSAFTIGYPSEGPSRLQRLNASLLATFKMCRAGADVDSGYLGGIRAVGNLSRPHCGSSVNGHGSKNIGNARVKGNSDAGFAT
jgi:hypothetical protein